MKTGYKITYKKDPEGDIKILNVKQTKGDKVTMVLIKSNDLNTYTNDQLDVFTAGCEYALKNNKVEPLNILKGIKAGLSGNKRIR